MGKTYQKTFNRDDEELRTKNASHHGHAKYKRGRKEGVIATRRLSETDLVKMNPKDLLNLPDFESGLLYDD